MTAGRSDRAGDSLARDRAELLEEIEREALYTADLTGRPVLAARVMEAMAAVPRHEFVPDVEPTRAYVNAPLPIGHGQTISQPFIVALMTELLDTEPDHVVLEIGTGSGYQAAVLAALVRNVYSIEIVAPLASQSAERLARLGHDNVEVRHGDGALGWPERAPFDGILVAAAAPEIPPALPAQLKRGGKLVIPVRGGWGQELTVVEKTASGRVLERPLLPVAFVPLVRAGRTVAGPD